MRAYFKALEAIRKLEDSTRTSWDTDEKSKKTTMRTCLNKSDVGFKELIETLKEYGHFDEVVEEIDEICLLRSMPKLSSGEAVLMLASVFEHPHILSKTMSESETKIIAKVGNEEKISISYLDISPTSDFTKMVDNSVRRKFATYVCWLAIALFILALFQFLYISIS